MEEEDIYGDDIYGDAGSLNYSNSGLQSHESLNAYAYDPPAPVKHEHSLQLQSSLNPAVQAGLQAQRIAEQDKRIVELELELEETQGVLEQWRDALKGSDPQGGGATLDPTALTAELRSARAAEKQLQEEVSQIRARDGALKAALAEKNLQNIELRRHLATARQAADPHIVQARQLLLDPAVAKEFQRLQEEAEKKAREAKAAQEELQAAHFSQESKAGRLLMAKCRALQEENEEMGREVAEGRVTALERQVALGRGYIEEMRTAYLELEDTSQQLDAEAEDLQTQIFKLKHQVRWHEERERPPEPRFGGPHGPPGGYGDNEWAPPGEPGPSSDRFDRFEHGGRPPPPGPPMRYDRGPRGMGGPPEGYAQGSYSRDSPDGGGSKRGRDMGSRDMPGGNKRMRG